MIIRNGFGVFHQIFLSNILQSNCSQPTWLFYTQLTICLPVQLLYNNVQHLVIHASGTYELRHEKTNVLPMRIPKLIGAFVFATWIVQSLYFLNTKFPASNHLQWLYSPVCVKPGQNPHCWFSHDVAHIL